MDRRSEDALVWGGVWHLRTGHRKAWTRGSSRKDGVVKSTPYASNLHTQHGCDIATLRLRRKRTVACSACPASKRTTLRSYADLLSQCLLCPARITSNKSGGAPLTPRLTPPPHGSGMTLTRHWLLASNWHALAWLHCSAQHVPAGCRSDLSTSSSIRTGGDGVRACRRKSEKEFFFCHRRP
jgi:hypothetical protein